MTDVKPISDEQLDKLKSWCDSCFGPASITKDVYELCERLRIAEAVVEAAECLGLGIQRPDGPDHHADMYSFSNDSVRNIFDALAAYRAAMEGR